MAISEHAPVLRIGVLSRRLGVSDHVLRAWERRYGLLRPVRTEGGFRLYSEADARRIRDMKRHLAQGLSAAEAARAVLVADGERSGGQPGGGQPGDGGALGGAELRGMLREALDGFDEPEAQAVLDRLLTELPVTVVLRDVVLPYLGELGERWEHGQASIAQEHFASNLIRGRLAGLARGWGEGSGPRAVLACPPGERHDLALMMFGIALNRMGWPIDYLGVDTPPQELSRTVRVRQPGLVVLAATRPESLKRQATHLTRLAQEVSLALAGAGASPQLAGAVGARLLDGDPVSAAGAVGRPA